MNKFLMTLALSASVSMGAQAYNEVEDEWKVSSTYSNATVHSIVGCIDSETMFELHRIYANDWSGSGTWYGPTDLDFEFKVDSQEWSDDETYLFKLNTSQFHTNKIVNEEPVFFYRTRPYEALIRGLERTLPWNGSWNGRTVDLDPQCYDVPVE